MLRNLTLLVLACSLPALAACSGSSDGPLGGGPGSGGSAGSGGGAGTGGLGGRAGAGGVGGQVSDDSEPPSLSIDSETTSEYRTYIVAGTAEDNVGVTEISVRVNGGQARSRPASDGDFGAFARLEEGDNLVEVTARDAAGNEGRESISVAYTPNPDAPSPPVTGGPTSIGLIDQALADGAIDEETAVLYRVYAIHQDDRLPLALRDDTGLIDATPILFDIAERLDSLSPETQALIRPFFIPPIYEESAFPNEGPSLAQKGPPVNCAARGNWQSRIVGDVRIWWNSLRSGHKAFADAIAAEVNPIWSDLQALTGRTPIQDTDPGIIHNGCSNHFDIYVDINLQGMAKVSLHPGHGNCNPWAGFMSINPSQWKLAEIEYVVAHELMHAFQLAYRTCLANPSVLWWTESSATWVVDHVYPTATDGQPAGMHFEHVFAEDYYLPTVDQSIYTIGASGFRPYGAYLWPFFIAGSGPSKVADIWAALGKSTSLPVILSTMDSHVPNGFHKGFADFMLQVWNQDPVDDFKKRELDGKMRVNPSDSMPKGVTEVIAHRDGEMDRNINLSLGVEPLAAEFVHIKFTDPSVHTALFSNGFTFEVKEGQVPGFELPDNTVYATKLSEEEKKGKRVWALVKQDGQWSQDKHDLTDVAFVPFCQDAGDEAIEELVLIFVNGRFEDTQPSTAKGLSPRLFVSNMGCGAWVGSATIKSRVMDAPRRTENIDVNITNIVFERPASTLEAALMGAGQRELLGTIVPAANFLAFPFGGSYQVSSLTANWSLSRNTLVGMNHCLANGAGMFNESHAMVTVFGVSPYLASSASSNGSLYRSYLLQLQLGTTNNAVTQSCTETGSSSAPFAHVIAGGFRQSPLGSFLVSSDGQTITKTWSPTPEITYTLDLNAAVIF